MAGRFIGITGMLHDDRVEIEEEIDTRDHLPLTSGGEPLPTHFVPVHRVYRQRRVVSISEAKALAAPNSIEVSYGDPQDGYAVG